MLIVILWLFMMEPMEKNSDGGISSHSNIGKLLNKRNQVPSDHVLPGFEKVASCVISVKAFPKKRYLPRPFPSSQCNN